MDAGGGGGGGGGNGVLSEFGELECSVGVLVRTTANGMGRGGVWFGCRVRVKSEGGSSNDRAGERGDDNREFWWGRGVGVVSRGRGVFS